MSSLSQKTISIGTAVVDKSGSMVDILNGLEGGLKELIQERQKQAKSEDMSLFRLIAFSSEAEQIYPQSIVENSLDTNFIDVAKINIADLKLSADGLTRLIDTALYEINLLILKKVEILKEDKNAKVKVWFMILTDGIDNISKAKAIDLHLAIQDARENHEIQCIFLGANQDAINSGNKYGFCRDSSLTFANNVAENDEETCVHNAMRCVSDNISQMVGNDESFKFSEVQRTSSVQPLSQGHSPKCSPKRCPSPLKRNRHIGLFSEEEEDDEAFLTTPLPNVKRNVGYNEDDDLVPPKLIRSVAYHPDNLLLQTEREKQEEVLEVENLEEFANGKEAITIDCLLHTGDEKIMETTTFHDHPGVPGWVPAPSKMPEQIEKWGVSWRRVSESPKQSSEGWGDGGTLCECHEGWCELHGND